MTDYSWKAALERDGFAHIPRALAPEDVEMLAALSLRSVDDYSESEDLIRSSDGVPLKLTYPLDKYSEFLSVLGRREVRDIVDGLLPKTDSVLTWEDVLIKMPHVSEEVGAHQDIGLDPVRQTIHSLGISLHHDADNPVCFLPGSHRLGPLTADTVAAIRKDCKEQFLPVVTQPGDVVIHNVHVLHYSEPNSSERPRATWYLEFTSLASLLERGPWSPDWAYRRRAIWVHAREAAGDDIGESESNEVRDHLARLRGGRSSFRVPHVTENVRYDPASPYHHFSRWTDDWKTSKLTPHGTHHVNAANGGPLYPARFSRVEKFHEPGLAPVHDTSGAYHITPDGLAAYESRYIRTFGFYEGRAAVHSEDGWFHLPPDGSSLYGERYAWCGNFQENRCTVRLTSDGYFHIAVDGSPAYEERYRYAGDFKDGYAVVQREDGKHTHIDASGKLVHGRWFHDLDVFHKRYARACDSNGWHHVDLRGAPLYERRFKTAEPFYNGQARVEGFDGSLSVIDESGTTLLTLRPPRRSALEALSADMVGLWRTQTIRAATEFGVFEILPAGPETVEVEAGLAPSMGARLLRALLELGLVRRDDEGLYHPTGRGAHLARAHPLSLADAALIWGREHYTAWTGITASLRTGESSFEKMYGQNIFDWMQNRRDDLDNYHAAFSSYARHDYRSLSERIHFGVHETVLDVGGGKGELMFGLLRACPALRGVVMDRTEVVERPTAPSDVANRCRFVAGDFFAEWPVSADGIILARVLHDWPDAAALRILKRARAAIREDGVLYLAEMVLDETSGTGGLLDLNMLVMTQGAERTERQFRMMLEEADFRMQRVIPIGSVSSVIEASPA